VTPASSHPGQWRGQLCAGLVFAATVAQLAAAMLLPDLPQFEGKAFGARLVAYPVMMAAAPVIWTVARRRRTPAPMPWTAFALIMAPFLVDVTGNTANLYDTIGWWDEANHFVNWLLLCSGLGLLLVRAGVTPRWVLVLTVTGLGALLAIGWELGEWYTFIRHGTEIGTAYQDTLGDEALGSLGALVAALIVGWSQPRVLAAIPDRR
jgi:uncharacterized membrane protein YjdF